MKTSERVKRFWRRMAICFMVLALCLGGCSSKVGTPSSDTLPTDSTAEGSLTDTSDSSPADSLQDPSDTGFEENDFEKDPYTTDFVIDRTLADAVREDQGMPDDMPLTREFAASVTELLLWDADHISTITGISNFTSLERLTMPGGDLKSIEELARMPSLTSVFISWGYITEIPDFSDCPNLTELYLSSNCITDLTPLCKATSLRFVDLGCNNISSVAPLKDVDFLEYLCLEGNCITDYGEIKDSAPLRQALDAGSQSPLEYALEAEETAKRIVGDMIDDSMAPEVKLATLYAYIIDNVSYDESYHLFRPFGYRALCTGVGVCGDYAEALSLLACHAGLKCVVVSSDTHAFNAVEFDGKWYLFDSLWDDVAESEPTNPLTWDYFGFTTETALALPDHAYDTKRYPVAEEKLQK